MNILKFEVASIQKYIFSSNKLKVNLGASYIIEHLLFNDLLKESISRIFGESLCIEIDNWFKAKDIINQDYAQNELKIAYIGGGNALLYSEDYTKLKALETDFKMKVLQAFPGLEIYSTIEIGQIDQVSEEQFIGINQKLNTSIKKNRTSNYFLNKNLNNGFFNKCSISGGVASEYWQIEKSYVSDEVMSKINYVEDANSKHMYDLIDGEIAEYFTFPIEFEDFSKKDKKNYIAIVHLDGNNLGQQFIDSESLNNTRELSIKIRLLGTSALKNLIKTSVIEKIRLYNPVNQESNSISKWDEIKSKIQEGYKLVIGDLEIGFSEKIILPIRPIITGGDDITFVCEGTLGIPLAVNFLKLFNNEGKKSGMLDGNVHACAGVSIIKQKYPFYRGYHLSDELIKEAKRAARTDHGSHISFMIAGYGTGTSLKGLREKYAHPNLYAQSYKVVEQDSPNHNYIDFENTLKFFKINENQRNNKKPMIPRNKLIWIREALVNNNIHEVWPIVKSRLNKDAKFKIDPVKNCAVTFEAIEMLDFINEAFLESEK